MAHKGAIALAEIIARRFEPELCRVRTNEPSCMARFFVCVESNSQRTTYCEPLRVNMEYLELLSSLRKDQRDKLIAKLIQQMATFLKNNYPQWPETLRDEPV